MSNKENLKSQCQYLIGCDVTPYSSLSSAEILRFYKELISAFPDIFTQIEAWQINKGSKNKKLLLTEKRDANTSFNAWNYIENNQLQDFIHFIPYYYTHPLGEPRNNCRVWIERNTPEEILKAPNFKNIIGTNNKNHIVIGNENKRVLFFTPVHPLRKEGNSTHIRMWLDELDNEGITTDIVFYDYSLNLNDQKLLEKTSAHYPNFYYLPRKSNLVSFTENGLNIHLDDWCGIEAVELTQKLCDQNDYLAVFVNYAGFSKVFEAVPKSTWKVLITHDRFADRNKRLLAEGYEYCRWLSFTPGDEKIACDRADFVVAIQNEEKAYFEGLVNDSDKVKLIPHLFNQQYLEKHIPYPDSPLKIGYFGSANDYNRTNIKLFIDELEKDPDFSISCELILAGGISQLIEVNKNSNLVDNLKIRKMGLVEDLLDFFKECHLVINPDRGGTGLKIKTLEALSCGMPILSTHAGFVGIPSKNEFHHAETIADLAGLCTRILKDRNLLEELRKNSITVYEDFYSTHKHTLRHFIKEVTIRNNFLFSHKFITDTTHPQNKYRQKPNERLPKVSVIIPFFNVEEYIEECILSVIKQTYKNIEIILVDDCSPDNSRAFVEKYVNSYDNVKVITHVQNLGVGPARNIGTQYANGDYILFLDSDDYLLEFCIEELVNIAQRENINTVIGSAERLLHDGSVIAYDRNSDHGDQNAFGIISGIDAFKRAFALPGTSYLPIRSCGTLFNTELFSGGINIFPPTYHQDMGTVPFIYASCSSVFYSEKVVYIYRLREDSLSTIRWDGRKTGHYIALWNIIKKNIKHHQLDNLLSNVAISQLFHLIYRINNHSLDLDARNELVEYFHQIGLDLILEYIDKEYFYEVFSYIQRVLFQYFPNKNDYLSFTGTIDTELLHSFYRQKINEILNEKYL